jgi:hypothetical protein
MLNLINLIFSEVLINQPTLLHVILLKQKKFFEQEVKQITKIAL